MIHKLTTYFKEEIHKFTNSKKVIIISILSAAVLLGGFSFGFVEKHILKVDEMIDIEMIESFDSYFVADEIVSNMAGDDFANDLAVQTEACFSSEYDDIELVDMRDENIGLRLIKIMLDRLLS